MDNRPLTLYIKFYTEILIHHDIVNFEENLLRDSLQM